MQSTTLTKALAAASILLAAGCADMRAPSGNPTSYATGSYRMPAKTQAEQPPMQARVNGDATAADSRTRSNAPVNAMRWLSSWQRDGFDGPADA